MSKKYPLFDDDITVEEMDDLTNDIMMLLASFSGKLYSQRAKENKRKRNIENK